MSTPPPDILIEERGPGSVALAVVIDGERFDCGVYLNRAEALKAGRLFAERKAGERVGRMKRPRKKA